MQIVRHVSFRSNAYSPTGGRLHAPGLIHRQAKYSIYTGLEHPPGYRSLDSSMISYDEPLR